MVAARIRTHRILTTQPSEHKSDALNHSIMAPPYSTFQIMFKCHLRYLCFLCSNILLPSSQAVQHAGRKKGAPSSPKPVKKETEQLESKKDKKAKKKEKTKKDKKGKEKEEIPKEEEVVLEDAGKKMAKRHSSEYLSISCLEKRWLFSYVHPRASLWSFSISQEIERMLRINWTIIKNQLSNPRKRTLELLNPIPTSASLPL